MQPDPSLLPQSILFPLSLSLSPANTHSTALHVSHTHNSTLKAPLASAGFPPPPKHNPPPPTLFRRSLPLYRDGTQTLAALVAFFLIDQLQVALGWFPRKETTGRYFSLHVLCNAFVTVVHLDDVYYTWMDPANSASVPCDMSGTNVMLALHLYHILAFPLTPIDWVHHISMVLVMTPLAYLFQPGHLMGHGAFFATGERGGEKGGRSGERKKGLGLHAADVALLTAKRPASPL